MAFPTVYEWTKSPWLFYHSLWHASLIQRLCTSVGATEACYQRTIRTRSVQDVPVADLPMYTQPGPGADARLAIRPGLHILATL